MRLISNQFTCYPFNFKYYTYTPYFHVLYSKRKKTDQFAEILYGCPKTYIFVSNSPYIYINK